MSEHTDQHFSLVKSIYLYGEYCLPVMYVIKFKFNKVDVDVWVLTLILSFKECENICSVIFVIKKTSIIPKSL